MDIKTYIQAGLDAGKSMEEIMNGIADVANEVMADLAKANENQEKYDRAQEILDRVDEFFTDYYPDLKLSDEDWEEVTGEELCELIDEIMPLLKVSLNLAKPVSQKPTKTAVSADDVIANFLRDMGI